MYVFQFGVLWVFFFLHESCVYSELFIGLLFDWITLSHDTDGTGRTPHTRYDELIQAMVIIILSCHGPHASLFVIAMMKRLEKKKCKKTPGVMAFCHLLCHLGHEISQSSGQTILISSLVGVTKSSNLLLFNQPYKLRSAGPSVTLQTKQTL